MATTQAPGAVGHEHRTLTGDVYRALSDYLPVSLIVLRADDGRVVRVNQQAQDEFGLDPDQVRGRGVGEVFGRVLELRFHRARRRAIERRGVVEEEVCLRSVGRPDRRINARLLVTFAVDGRPDMVVVIARDTTAERAAQLELAESRVRFQEFAAAIDDGLFVRAPERDRFDFISAQALRLLGATEPELAADPGCWRRNIHPDDLPGPAGRALSGAALEPVDTTFRLLDAQRGERWLRARTWAQRLSCGGLRVYGLLSDVTAEHAHEEELERARQAAEAASQAKSQFMANMSHEIRTPMNGILGMTELLLGTPLVDKQHRFAKAVYRSGEALLEIINDILDFSKIEAGKLELAPSDFVLRSVIEDTLELLAPRAHEKGVELSFLAAPNLPALVRADALRLRQVITNLVANAIKFTERGEVVVALQAADGEGRTLAFTVRDTGIGISPETLPQLFSAFTQGSGGMSRRYGGTGLGLTISRQLIELMGGRIEVQSQLGVGSSFAFTVPVEAASPGAREPEDVVELPPMRVLVVEDHETNRLVLDNLLGAWGMQVVMAQDGEEALSLLRAAARAEPPPPPFDLALVDMHMPRLDGLGLAHALKAEGLAPQMKLILLSSVCSPDDVQSAQAAGFGRFVAKPLRGVELRQAIAGVVQAEQAPPLLDAALARHMVLVVEDNGVNQEVIGQMLRHLGARVTMASSAMDGLRALTEQRFDLVLMDIQMPGMDGTEALRWLRRGPGGRFAFKTAADTPVVAVTANALGGDAERFIHLGFDDYLSKPFRQSQLHAMLKRHLKMQAADDGVEPGVPGGMAPVPSDLPAELLGLLDAQALARLRELDPSGRNGLLPKILQTFDSSLSRLLAQLQEGRQLDNLETLHHVAHTLKSSSASVGALELSRICADIERLLRQHQTEGLPRLLDDMVAQSQRILCALKPVLDSPT